MDENELEKTQEEQESKTTPDTEGEVILAPEGTPLAVFQKERTDAISEMFNNEDEYGIFPTGKFYARLDKCVESLLTSRDTYWKERVGEIRLLIAKYAKAEDMDVAGLVNEINTLCK